jgi:site-specific recombinase XerD
MLLREAQNEWLSYHMEIRRYTQGSLKDMKCSINRLLLYLEKRVPGRPLDTSSLTTADLLGWVEHVKKTGVAHTTVLKNLSHLNSFLDYLECREIISSNPASLVKLKRTASKMTKDFLTQEEVASLFREAQRLSGKADFRDYCIVALLYGTGLRANELCCLRMGDVSVGRETIFVNNGKRGRQRYIPIPGELLTLLKEYKRMRGNKGHLFFQMKGERPVTLSYLRELMRRLAKAAQIAQKVTPKTMRHSYATHLVEEGVKIPVVAKLMGHKSIKESSPYLHVTTRRLKQAIEEHPAYEILSGLEAQK